MVWCLYSSCRGDNYRWKEEQLTNQRTKLEHQVMQLELSNRELRYSLDHAREQGRTNEHVSRQLHDQLDRLESRLSLEVEGKQVAELKVRELEVKLRSTKASQQQQREDEELLKGRLQTEMEAKLLQEKLYQEQVGRCNSRTLINKVCNRIVLYNVVHILYKYIHTICI